MVFRNQRHTQLVSTRMIVVQLAAHLQQQVQQVTKQRLSRRKSSCHSRPMGLRFHNTQSAALVELCAPGSTWTKATTPSGLGWVTRVRMASPQHPHCL